MTNENQTSPLAAGSDGSTSHYGPATDPYEVIKVLDAWQVDAYQFQVIKYLARWRKKGGLADLKKAKFYLDRYIGIEESKIPKSDPTKTPHQWKQYRVSFPILTLITNNRITIDDALQHLKGFRLSQDEAYAILDRWGVNPTIESPWRTEVMLLVRS